MLWKCLRFCSTRWLVSQEDQENKFSGLARAVWSRRVGVSIYLQNRWCPKISVEHLSAAGWHLSCLFILTDTQMWSTVAALFPTPSNRCGACPAQPGTPPKNGLQLLFPYNQASNSKIHRDLEAKQGEIWTNVFFSSFCWNRATVWRGQWHCLLGKGEAAHDYLLVIQAHQFCGPEFKTAVRVLHIEESLNTNV